MWPWNRKRLDDLEERIRSIEEKKIWIPSNVDHCLADRYGFFNIGKHKPTYVWDAISLIVDYLHLKYEEEPAKNKIHGILDEIKPTETPGESLY